MSTWSRPLGVLGGAVVLATILLGVPSGAKAGGWARDQGGVFVRAGVGTFFGEQRLLVSEFVGPGNFTQVAGELYGEVGLGAALEIDLSLRWVDNAHELDSETLHNRGMEELELLLKWAPISETNALAFVIGGRASLYDSLGDEQLAEGMPERGPGGGDVLVGASFGHSFHPLPGWINLDVLHRIRVGTASSGVLLRTELGYTLVGPLTGALTLELQPAFGRDIDRAEGDPRPVPTVLGLGAKLFATIAAGFGVLVETMWFPDVLNDGPGIRLGLSATYQR